MIESLSADRNAVAMLVSLAVLAVALPAAVYLELARRRIPNWLTFPAMAAGLLTGFIAGGGAFRQHAWGLLIGGGFLFLFYIFGGVGGGDVKLMGAAGSLLGAEMVKPALFYTAAVGALMAVMILIWRKVFWRDFRRALTFAFLRRKTPEEAGASEKPATVPYGVAIAVGCLLALFTR